MLTQIKSRAGLLLPLLLVVTGEALVFALGPFGMSKERSGADWLFLSVIAAHLLLLILYTGAHGRLFRRSLFRLPEPLLAVGLLFFLFSYIYASNANMSYAQWFAETSGNIRLAPDSRIQRLNSMLRYLPFILYDAAVILRYRLAGGLKGALSDRILAPRATSAAGAAHGRALPAGTARGGEAGPTRLARAASRWALPLSILSALLYTFSLPSFLTLQGVTPLAFIALIPLYAVLRYSSYRWALFYGVLFGSLQTMLANYWLGTYSLISLQFAVVVLFLEFALFFIPALYLLRKFPGAMVWLLPLLWTTFDFLRSSGFLGYPWGILGTSLYRTPLLIQTASVGGVWLVSLTVHLSNSLLFEAADRRRPRPLLILMLMWIAVAGYGGISMQYWRDRVPEGEVRVSLIQQNTDPRKHDYRYTFTILADLTREVLPEEPDLIAWSETAFVPNIRKWGAMEPGAHSLAALVHEFRRFQESIETWLITGNDDYEEVEQPDGSVQRDHYNATVLFDRRGNRVRTYRKIRLVPFTEYFPYKEQVPWLHGLLKDFDATLWEKGEVPVVFSHPKVDFSTPICFEDSFPGEIRMFMNRGAQMILNLTNDFWSRTKVEGEQHFANSLFRAVEHRRPLLRSTASGKTAYVDPAGRVVDEIGYYREDTLTVDAALYGEPVTLYGLFGDWLPAGGGMLALVLLVIPAGRRRG